MCEALHLSEGEEPTVNEGIANIKNEYEQHIDNHIQLVIVFNLALLLNYSLRFYDRSHVRTEARRWFFCSIGS